MAYIPSDVQSVKSQATYSSGLPSFAAAAGPFAQNGQRANSSKRPGFASGYASSVISQDPGHSAIDTASLRTGTTSTAPSVANIAYSQSDRLRRRLSQSSLAGVSDLGSNLSALDYKSQDEAIDLDDLRSQYSQSQSGFTEF